jgi:N-acetylglucosaminyl-diphospho-decaprenol L-rhamnosyltransferase
MDLSVLIVTYNSRDDIAACLRSLPPALDGLTSEILVIDNHSADGTAGVVREQFPGVRLIELPANKGFASGIRAGIAASTGAFLLWINPDTQYVSGLAADIVSWMTAHPNTGIAGGRIVDPDGAVQLSARTFPSYGAVAGARYSLLTRLFPGNPWSRRFLRTDLSHDRVASVDWVSGAFLFHTREVNDRIGGPDEQFFMYFEDVDFCYRARLAGADVVFHPGMTVSHRIGGSSRSAPAALLVARHRSLWRWYTKHFRRFWLKDAVVWTGVWLRCATLIAAGFLRQWRSA